MRRYYLVLLVPLVLIGCKKATWHKTSNGYWIYTIANDKYAHSWTGSTIGSLVNGEGQLISYNTNDEEIERQSLTTNLGISSDQHYISYSNFQYLGEIEDDLPEGFGVKIQNDSIFIGVFNEGSLYEGFCEIYKRSCEDNYDVCFQGNYKKGRVYGYAKCYVDNMLSFEGNFRNGRRHGMGNEYKHGSLIYSGNFKKGKRSGFGKEYDDGKLIYEGEWSKGYREGKGIQYNKENGLIVYDGFWEDNVYDGKGKLYKDGKYIEGKWEEGILTQTISTSTFDQMVKATRIFFGNDSLLKCDLANQTFSSVDKNQQEFIGHLHLDIQNYLDSHLQDKIESRFGFWHLPRMIFQPWLRSDVKRAKFAQDYFCKELEACDLQQFINNEIDYYNKNSPDTQLHYVKIEDIPLGAIVDSNVALKIFDREAIETTDQVVGVIIDILICIVLAALLGFIIGLFVPVLIPYCGIIDIVLTLVSIVLGVYIAIIRTCPISIDLENQIKKMLIDNYMLFLDNQNVIFQILGL